MLATADEPDVFSLGIEMKLWTPIVAFCLPCVGALIATPWVVDTCRNTCKATGARRVLAASLYDGCGPAGLFVLVVILNWLLWLPSSSRTIGIKSLSAFVAGCILGFSWMRVAGPSGCGYTCLDEVNPPREERIDGAARPPAS